MTTLKSDILKLHLRKYGFDQEFLNTFEVPTDQKMQNFDALIDELRRCFETRERILVYTDFDVDGISCGVIGYAGLSELGFECELYKPLPALGYGMHNEDIDRILQLHPDCKTILTADVGINENNTIEYAHSKGLRVLVTDHHPAKRPCKAEISVNPQNFEETYPHPGICGAHVLWMVLFEYAQRYCNPVKIGDIWRLRMFAGIATVADSMPLLYENRQLVRDAISIAQYYYTYDINTMGIVPPVYSAPYSMCFAGIVQLLKHFEDEGKIRKTSDISETFFGFYLVPMLNSCKRMDGDMNALYDIFFAQCVHAEPEYPDMPCVDNAISYIAELNNERKLIVDEKFREVMQAREHALSNAPADTLMSFVTGYDEKALDKAKLGKYADCDVYIMDIGGGLCGLLATKVMNVTGKPCLVLYKNEDGGYNGSGRSPAWFPFFDRMQQDKIIDVGGHNAAFGVRIHSDNELEKYRSYFHGVIENVYREVMNDTPFDPYITLSLVDDYDACDFKYDEMMVRQFLSETELLHPYGMAFPEVKFRVVIPSDFYGEVFGSLNNHVKLVTRDGTEFVWFSSLVDFELLLKSNTEKRPYVATGRFEISSFSGMVNFIIDTMDILQGDNDENSSDIAV